MFELTDVEDVVQRRVFDKKAFMCHVFMVDFVTFLSLCLPVGITALDVYTHTQVAC